MSSKLNEAESDALATLLVILMQHHSVQSVRRFLQDFQAQGLDVKKLYRSAASGIAEPTPTWDEVKPAA